MMNKKCLAYRYIAEHALADKKMKFTVRGIASDLSVAPDTISNAAAPLKRTGAIDMQRRYFTLINFEKLLAIWAVARNFDRDIEYKTYVARRSTAEIEDMLPSGIAYTNYSGYTKLFGNAVSTYSEVYAYATEQAVEEIKKRFPKNLLSKGSDYGNLIILRPDYVLSKRIMGKALQGSAVSMPQLYVDLWNAKEWYAYEFLRRLKEKIDDKYAKAILE
jgi:DNA-binding transcriptional regulator YhcF (GntR family)